MGINWGRALMTGTSGALDNRRALEIAERLRVDAEARDLSSRQTLAGEDRDFRRELFSEGQELEESRYNRGRLARKTDLTEAKMDTLRSSLQSAGIEPLAPGESWESGNARLTEHIGTQAIEDRSYALEQRGVQGELQKIQIANAWATSANLALENERLKAIDPAESAAIAKIQDRLKMYGNEYELVSGTISSLSEATTLSVEGEAELTAAITRASELRGLMSKEYEEFGKLGVVEPPPGGEEVLDVDDVGSTYAPTGSAASGAGAPMVMPPMGPRPGGGSSAVPPGMARSMAGNPQTAPPQNSGWAGPGGTVSRAIRGDFGGGNAISAADIMSSLKSLGGILPGAAPEAAAQAVIPPNARAGASEAMDLASDSYGKAGDFVKGIVEGRPEMSSPPAVWRGAYEATPVGSLVRHPDGSGAWMIRGENAYHAIPSNVINNLGID